MGWTEATYTNRSGKHQQVWVQTDDEGELAVDDGRASMRYQNEDDAKVYSAQPRNLALDEQQPAVRGTGKNTKPKNGTKYDDDVWKAPLGARVRELAVPAGLENEGLPPSGVIDAWTDGACTGNPGPCGYGLVLRFGVEYVEVCQYIGTGTNNIAELLAIGVALEETQDIEGRLRVHTDSNYSIGVLSKGWKAKANTELIESIRKRLTARPGVEFIKVKGHAGIPLNERADELAGAAVERRK